MSSDNPNARVGTDYGKLSELYGTFLGALGGVSITVLSIVMAFNTERVRLTFRPYLIAALSAAAFSCFTGGHLMAETAAFVSKSREERTGARLCAIATINIYNSVVIIIFSLFLMVAGLSKDAGYNSDGLRLFFIALFTCVLLSALRWMRLTIKTRLDMSHDAVWLGWLITCYLVAVDLFILYATKCVLWMSLVVTVGATFVSLFHFTKTFEQGDRLIATDVYVFTSCIILPCFSIVLSCICVLELFPKFECHCDLSKLFG
ncbi:MAG TPA: hypothetical protein VJT82_12030 [Pyrinomonadaceae bacterium]|nr:hypothetical protein [Pyrinomonadaceae bacterium]